MKTSIPSRTKEQLGYIAMSLVRKANGSNGIVICAIDQKP